LRQAKLLRNEGGKGVNSSGEELILGVEKGSGMLRRKAVSDSTTVVRPSAQASPGKSEMAILAGNSKARMGRNISAWGIAAKGGNAPGSQT